jgi:hypothetical protein
MHVCALRSQIEGMGTRFEIIPHFVRPSTRARVYMSAFNARKYNPVIGEFYRRLVSRGKTFKQAMTACYEEAAGADEHARGPGAALGRVPRDLIPPSGPCIEPVCEGF